MIGLGLGIGKNNFSFRKNLLNLFKTRVLADGGIFEASNCLSVFLGTLVPDLIFQFEERVNVDGGILEAKSCLATTLTNLN